MRVNAAEWGLDHHLQSATPALTRLQAGSIPWAHLHRNDIAALT